MAVKFFSFLAVVFISLLLIGLILPGTWEVERSLEMPAVPQQVFAYVNDVSLWEAWTDWPEAAAERFGPSTGVGAGRSWNDPEFGDGVFTIVESVAGERVRYRVEVEDGSMITEGSIAPGPARRRHRRHPGDLARDRRLRLESHPGIRGARHGAPAGTGDGGGAGTAARGEFALILRGRAAQGVLPARARFR